VVHWKHVFGITGSFPTLVDEIQWFVVTPQAADIAGTLQLIQGKLMFFGSAAAFD
jgi:hypothetical protein